MYFKKFKILVTVLIGTLFIISIGCMKKDSSLAPVDRTRTIEISNELVIGLESEADSVAQILGQPVGVVTDEEENIYIGDKASLTIKVFDKDGNYLKSLGRRGRGPNEFHDINFMGAAPENNILVLDRGNFRYTTITKQGEYVSDYVIKFENQFYLEDVAYLDDKLIGLYLYQGSAEERDYSDLYERNFFRVLTPDLNEKTSEFGPFHDLNISDSFGWISSALYQGSFTLDRKNKAIYFSPGIYTGDIFKYGQNHIGDWELTQKIKGTPPYSEPYITYDSENEYEKNKDFPGVSDIAFSWGHHLGRVNSIDAGIHFLPEKEQIVHFYGEWREGDITMENGNLLDISVQIFDQNGKLLKQSYLFSSAYDDWPKHSFTDWVDQNENFYMIDFIDSVPVVRKFSLDI